MNDKQNSDDGFLYSLRRAPRSEFSAALAARLGEGEEMTMMEKRAGVSLKRAALAIAALIVTAGGVLAVSPAARAMAQDVVRMVAGLGFIDSDTTPEGGGEQVTVTTRELTLDEAQSMLPLKLPAQLPDGFAPYDGRYDPPITVTEFAYPNGTVHQIIDLRWENLNGPMPAVISLGVMDRTDVNWLVGDANAVEEIRIGDMPAAIWYGAWNADTGQFEGTIISLSWIDGGLNYMLVGDKSQGTTLDDLLIMAGSMD